MAKRPESHEVQDAGSIRAGLSNASTIAPKYDTKSLSFLRLRFTSLIDEQVGYLRLETEAREGLILFLK